MQCACPFCTRFDKEKGGNAARCISANQVIVLRCLKGSKAVLVIQIPEPPYEFDAKHQTPMSLLKYRTTARIPQGFLHAGLWVVWTIMCMQSFNCVHIMY